MMIRDDVPARQATHDNPLAHSALAVTITDLVAEYELSHVFRNRGARSMEAVYSFPVPLDAAFLGMEARLAGELLVAEVHPRATATRNYDGAIADGDSAVLLERLEPGLLCVSLGNLKPGEDGEIRLRFAAPLHCADGAARFTLPLVHRPRYGRSQLDEITEPGHDFALEHPLEATIRVRGLLADAPVSCAAHAARFSHDTEGQNVRLNQAMLDRDIVLVWDLPADFTGTARLIQDGDAVIGMLGFNLPSAPARSGPCDLGLLLDCSGSMAGDAMAQSRAALQAVSEALGDEDRIHVLRFGSKVERLFNRLMPATTRVRDAIRSLADSLLANLGGTEMGDALRTAIRALVKAGSEPGRGQAIILVTDGAVHPSSLEQAEGLARQHGIHIFVVAVGSSAGTDVLQPLAAATGATLERAVPAEPIDEAVMRQLRRARAGQPVAVDIDWGTPAAKPLPIDHAWPGDAVTAFALLPASEVLEASVTLDGVRQEQVFRAEHALDAPALRALAGHVACHHAPEKDKEALALRYGLVTEQTAAVLVKQRAAGDKADGLPTVTPVRHMQPAGMVEAYDAQISELVCAREVAASSYPEAFMFSRRADDAGDDSRSEADLEDALLQALIDLLLVEKAHPVTLHELLDRIDPELHEQAIAYLARECAGAGVNTATATRLLRDLLSDQEDDYLPAVQRLRLDQLVGHYLAPG